MFLTINCILLLLTAIYLPQNAETAPSFTVEPTDRSVVVGDNTTLHWAFDIDGSFLLAQLADVSDESTPVPIGSKVLTNNVTVASNFQARFRATITDAQASLTILDVQRSDDGTYRLTIQNGDVVSRTSNVKISVQYVPEKTNLSSNATDGKVCLDALVQFTCVSDASPPVHSYLLYKDNVVVGNSSSGVWSISMAAGGNSSYKCEANNTVGNGVSESISVLVNVPPVISLLNNQTVEEGDTVTLNCTVPDGSPNPTVTWTDVSSGERRDGKTWTITNINRADAGEYRCDASNECGNRTRSTFVTVHYPASNLLISDNQTKNEGDVVTLNCTAEGNPAPDITWTKESHSSSPGGNLIPDITQTKGSHNSSAPFLLNITGKQDEGNYRCTADNGVGTPASDDVFVTVENYRPVETKLNTSLQNDIVELNVMFNITCRALANPIAIIMYQLYKDGVFNGTSNDGLFTRRVSNRVERVKYGCIPNNSYGDGPEKNLTVTVHYPPNITEPKTGPIGVLAGDPIDINCTADGNPPPNIAWINATTGEPVGSGGKLSFNPANESDSGFTYICTAVNGIEPNATSNITLIVGSNITTIIIKLLHGYILEYKDVSSTESKAIILRIQNWLRLIPEINNTAVAIEVLRLSNGSVIAEVVLKFKQIVHIGSLISAIRDAAENGSIGDLNVDPTSIRVVQEPKSTSSPSTTPDAAPKTTPKEETSDFPWWILGVAVGGLILLAIVIAIVAWCIHKKRKCRRKDTRVHSENEAQPLEEFSNGTPNGENAENAYAQVNHGYAKSGPAPTNENNQGAASASAVPPVTYAVVDKSKKNEKPPEYAVVDKSKKKKKNLASEETPPGDQYAAVDKSKKKKKKSGANEEKPPEDQYAVVLKSQKKKNPEEPEQQYAQVDRSMKKKHAKPGEVLYADLGEFHGNNSLPKVSTSPEPLPPIKKPTAYVETQYADITQFLKGDATLPSSDGTGGVTPAAQGQAPAGAQHAKPGEVLYADVGDFQGNNSLPKVLKSPKLLPPIKKPPLPSSDGTGGETPAAQGQPTAGAQVGTGGAAAKSPGEEAGGGSSHVSKL